MEEKSKLEKYLLEQGDVLLVDKPREWTSFDVVNKIRSTLRYKYGIKKMKVGHAGTLDPLATGLLIICLGKTTKKIDQFQELPKVYEGIFCIGATTPSYDLETEIDNRFTVDHLSEEKFLKAAKHYTGSMLQVPPLFSAVKIKGKRAYEYARKEEELKLKPRSIEIYRFDIKKIIQADIFFEIECSKGTYIRSVARDFGEYLDNGAYLKSLRRLKIGEFHVNKAISIDDIICSIDNLNIE